MWLGAVLEPENLKSSALGCHLLDRCGKTASAASLAPLQRVFPGSPLWAKRRDAEHTVNPRALMALTVRWRKQT